MKMAARDSKSSSSGETVDCEAFTSAAAIVGLVADVTAADAVDDVAEAVDSTGDDDVMAVCFRGASKVLFKIIYLVRKR